MNKITANKYFNINESITIKKSTREKENNNTIKKHLNKKGYLTNLFLIVKKYSKKQNIEKNKQYKIFSG